MPDRFRDGDSVVVCRLDRLSRSSEDVLHIMERLAGAGAGLRSVTERIGAAAPAGRATMRTVGSLAGSERAAIRQRPSAGPAAARAAGRVGGRRGTPVAAKRLEVAESVTTDRGAGAGTARPRGLGRPAAPGIVARHRAGPR